MEGQEDREGQVAQNEGTPGEWQAAQGEGTPGEWQAAQDEGTQGQWEDPPQKDPYKKGMRRGILVSLVACLLVILILFVGIYSNYDLRLTKKNASWGDVLNASSEWKLQELIAQISDLYYEDVDADDLKNGLYKGLFEGIGDPYSAYYTKEEYDSMMASTSGSYEGIGAVLSQDVNTMQVSVLHIYEDAPAAKAGIKDGDIIVKVNDILATDVELSELVTYIRGEKGTTVHIQVLRGNSPDYLEFDIERDQVEVPTVSYEMMGEEVGYIQITEFADPTYEQFMAAVEDLQKQGMQKMVVDLRDNPGGYLTAVTDILDALLPEGLIVYTEDKYGNRQNYTSDAEHQMDIPLVVLVNENSASASEIFAGAIKDYGYGTLVGTKTFGKGIVQSIRQLTDGSAIKLTTAKYYTPKGNYIHGVGIEPDVELELEYTGDLDAEYDKSKDNQIQKALSILQSNDNAGQ